MQVVNAPYIKLLDLYYRLMTRFAICLCGCVDLSLSMVAVNGDP